MNLVLTLLLALPLGFLVRSRHAALVGYLIADLFVFSFQSTWLLLGYLAHEGRSAFGPFPDQLPIDYSTEEYLGYGAVNLIITTAGIGLVLLGGRLRSRREHRRDRVEVHATSGG